MLAMFNVKNDFYKLILKVVFRMIDALKPKTVRNVY